jgi:hypothetical protein
VHVIFPFYFFSLFLFLHSKAMCMSISLLSHHISLMQRGGEREEEAYFLKK